MNQASRLLAIGAGVGVATAGVITFMVVKGDPTEAEEPPHRFTRTAEPVETPAAPRPEGGPKPAPTPAPVAQADASTTPAAKDAAKAAEDARKADAKVVRQQVVDRMRKSGGLDKIVVKRGAFASLTGTGDISSGFDDSNVYGGLIGNEVGEMNGGFGYGLQGTGRGGGTGWGTIGTGRYGTIGRGGGGGGAGYGVGAGRGGMRGRSTTVPTISIGQPSVADPGLDKALIRRYVRRNIQKLRYCYEKELQAKPSITGTVTTRFVIIENGTVGNASATGVDPEVASCMAKVLRAIEFPRPKGTGGVTVTYPFTVRPGGP